MHVVLIGSIAVAVVALVIERQLAGEALRGRRVILLPVVLLAIGALSLTHTPLNDADAVCIAIGAVVAAGIGVAQGLTMRLESRNGALWGQMPVRGLWLWLALIASRLALAGIAIPLGAHAVSSADSILLVLGINRLAQAALIVVRASSAGISFAPEKDGKPFLPGLLGQTSQAAARADAQTVVAARGVSKTDVLRLLADRFVAKS